MTSSFRGVQRTSATLRWTGSWFTHFVAIDRQDGQALESGFESRIREFVEPYRLAGHDLELDDPIHVPLEVGLDVCVRDGYFRADVRGRLLEILSNRRQPDGTPALFHPDRLSFGQPVYLSPILAATRQVPGVESAEVVTFERQGVRERRSLEAGVIKLGRLEVARLDNDPNRPENGIVRLDVSGGM